MLIIKPQLVAFDTSILAGWAADTYSANAEARRTSAHALDFLWSSNWLPTLSWHQAEELLCHADPDVCSKRMRFLSSLPHVAWVRSRSSASLLGTIVDLLATELKVLASLGETDLTAFRSAVRGELYSFGKVSELASVVGWKELRPCLPQRQVRDREIASIAHTAENKKSPRAVLSELNGMTLVSNTEAERLFAQQASDLTQDLADRGDRRLDNPKALAQAFTDDVSAAFERVRDADTSHLKAFCSELDIPEEDIHADMTLEEFSELAAKRGRLRVACDSLGYDLDHIWPIVREKNIPSQYIQSKLRTAQKSARRASGSDLTDAHLAAFLPYVDCVIVDKRTHEYLLQVSRRDSIAASLIGRFEKLSSYRGINAVLKTNA